MDSSSAPQDPSQSPCSLWLDTCFSLTPTPPGTDAPTAARHSASAQTLLVAGYHSTAGARVSLEREMKGSQGLERGKLTASPPRISNGLNGQQSAARSPPTFSRPLRAPALQDAGLLALCSRTPLRPQGGGISTPHATLCEHVSRWQGPGPRGTLRPPPLPDAMEHKTFEKSSLKLGHTW